MHITEILPNLPPAVALEFLHSLRSSLPPPADDKAREARDNAAIAHLASLHPADAAEADLAVQACHRA